MFTLRIPFYHFRFEWPETIQGLVVAGATGMGLIPILVGYLGLSFEVSLAVVIVQSFLIASAPLIFGDPYCHGWITPAIPLVLALMGHVVDEPEMDQLRLIQLVTVFTLMCAAIFFLAGITGLGRVFVERIPVPLKAGIIFGAAVAAFHHEFSFGEGTRSYLARAPYSATCAVAICLILMFSVPIARLKHKYRWIAILAGLGLAPGFLVAMVVGSMANEFQFNVEWGIHSPPFGEMYRQLSPLSLGFPNDAEFWSMVLWQVLPLAVIVYIIGFGDIITANELLRSAMPHRPDEKLDINPTRTHFNISIRNALQALAAGPFPVVHGPLWTGVQVVVTERYKDGRKAMDSIFGGIGAYYFWGIPILLFVKPITSFLEPMLPVALSMTILLTGFACGYIGMALPRNNVERGVAMSTGMVLVLFGAWQGLLVGAVMTLVLTGWPFIPSSDHEEVVLD